MSFTDFSVDWMYTLVLRVQYQTIGSPISELFSAQRSLVLAFWIVIQEIGVERQQLLCDFCSTCAPNQLNHNENTVYTLSVDRGSRRPRGRGLAAHTLMPSLRETADPVSQCTAFLLHLPEISHKNFTMNPDRIWRKSLKNLTTGYGAWPWVAE